jgi:hypothetical protein
MKNINWQKSLVGRKNNVGYTPLEDLESTLELMRTTDERGVRVSCKDAKFRGFPEEAIACLTLLREGKLRLSRIEKLRLKYGCTCGNCIRGFLSLRMKTALVHEAQMCHCILSEDGCTVKGPDGDHLMHSTIMAHLPPDMRGILITDKSLRDGFDHVFRHILLAMSDDRPPSVEEVLRYRFSDPASLSLVDAFYDRGGTTEAALRYMFEGARNRDHDARNGLERPQIYDELLSMPKCRNDGEFEFVALICGVPYQW